MKEKVDTVSVFRKNASKGAKTIDGLIASDKYYRGDLFKRVIKSTFKANSHFLDYGCGTGRITKLIASMGHKGHGMDPSDNSIVEANKQLLGELDITYEVCIGHGEQLKDQVYDYIVCSSVIEFVPNPELLLSNFKRSLKKDGQLIISFANKESIWRKYAEFRFGKTEKHFDAQVHTWSYNQFKKMLTSCGFNIINKPIYFESPFDGKAILNQLNRLKLFGSLGLIIAKST